MRNMLEGNRWIVVYNKMVIGGVMTIRACQKLRSDKRIAGPFDTRREARAWLKAAKHLEGAK